MPGKPPAYQHYAADWLAGTAHLSLEAQGAYQRLLDHEWLNGPLANDPRLLARLLGVSGQRFRSLWADLAAHFPPQPDGQIANPRLEEERRKQAAYREERARSGARGAEARWGKARPFQRQGLAP